jgi:hypothetical protein
MIENISVGDNGLVDVQLSFPIYTMMYAGTHTIRSRQTFLSAFLAAIVELGGVSQDSEIGQHLLAGVPLQVSRSILHQLESFDLLSRSELGLTLTPSGLKALATDQIPQDDSGIWAVDFCVIGTNQVQLLRIESTDVKDRDLGNAVWDKRNGGTRSSGVRLDSSPPQALFDTWTGEIGSSATEHQLKKPTERPIFMDTNDKLSVRYQRIGTRKSHITYWRHGEKPRSLGPQTNLRECLAVFIPRILEEAQNLEGNHVDALSDEQVLTQTTSWSSTGVVLDHKIKCEFANVEGMAIKRIRIEDHKWFLRTLALRVPWGVSINDWSLLCAETAAEFGVTTGGTPHELVAQVTRDLIRVNAQGSEAWWKVHAPFDWGIE